MVVCRPRLNGGSTPRRLMMSTRRLTSVTPVRGMAVSAILALSLLSLWATAQAPPAKNAAPAATKPVAAPEADERSEEHTSELSHSSISYAVFCLKKKKQNDQTLLVTAYD